MYVFQNLAFKDAIRNVNENLLVVGLKLHGIHQLLAYENSVNLSHKTSEILPIPNKKASLEIDTEKTKYILMPSHQYTPGSDVTTLISIPEHAQNTRYGYD